MDIKQEKREKLGDKNEYMRKNKTLTWHELLYFLQYITYLCSQYVDEVDINLNEALGNKKCGKPIHTTPMVTEKEVQNSEYHLL